MEKGTNLNERYVDKAHHHTTHTRTQLRVRLYNGFAINDLFLLFYFNKREIPRVRW